LKLERRATYGLGAKLEGKGKKGEGDADVGGAENVLMFHVCLTWYK
jgi:hypothetical protein